MNWKALQKEIDTENKRLESDPPEDVLRVVHYRIIDSGSGTGGNVLGNWFFSFSDIRYVAAYLYQIFNLSLDDTFSTDQIRFMAKKMISQPAEFAGYCGFNKLWDFVRRGLDVLDEIEDREEVLDFLNSIFLYASQLHTWINHYFPWRLDYCFPRKSHGDVTAMNAYIS